MAATDTTSVSTATEAQEVEAAIIEDGIAQLSRAEQWLAGAAERVAQRCELYHPPASITSEAQRKDVAAARTQVRRDAAKIDAERKAILHDMEIALKTFKSNVKDILSPLTDLDVEYKRLLDEFEEARRSSRMAELEAHYRDFAPSLVPLVSFEQLVARFGNERGRAWDRRSTNIVAAKQELEAAVETIADAERLIGETADPADAEDILARYFATLDIDAAFAEAYQAKEQRQRVRQLEAERNATTEPEPSEATPPTQAEDADEGPAHADTQPATCAWTIIIPSATRAQMVELARVLRSLGLTGTIRPAKTIAF